MKQAIYNENLGEERTQDLINVVKEHVQLHDDQAKVLNQLERDIKAIGVSDAFRNLFLSGVEYEPSYMSVPTEASEDVMLDELDNEHESYMDTLKKLIDKEPKLKEDVILYI